MDVPNLVKDDGEMASDSGHGKLGDYKYNLVPANKRVTIRLADSDPYQEELASLGGEENDAGFRVRDLDLVQYKIGTGEQFEVDRPADVDALA